MADAYHCQACHLLTTRSCSVCGVCFFCSGRCEFNAANACLARVACHMHMRRARERPPEDVGEAALHLRMMPTVPVELPKDPPSQHLWDVLFHGAKHYLHLLFACTPSTVYKNTVFGMATVLSDDEGQVRLAAGFQRLAYVVGERDDAEAMVIGNASDLAYSLLCDSPAQRAVLLLGVIDEKCVKGEWHAALHFDALFLSLNNDNTWTIQGTKPVWAQTLNEKDERLYTMHYQPKGDVPEHMLLRLSVAERALTPAQTHHPTPAPGAEPEEMPSLSSEASSLSEEWYRQPPRPRPRHRCARAAPPQAPPPAPGPAPDSLPPASALEWEAHREEALARAEATTEAPPWTEQLRAALLQEQ